jgi:hypothetical protein
MFRLLLESVVPISEVEVEVNLRPTVSRPVRHEIFRRQLRLCCFVAPSLTRGRVCNLLFNCFWAMPEQSLLSENHTEHTDTVRTSQETHYVSATETNRLMLFGETVAVYRENHTEFAKFLCMLRPPLWSSGQSFWLQIRRPGFDSRHYQKKCTGSGTGSTQRREYN